MHVQLVQLGRGIEILHQHFRLIVKVRAARIACYFLQAHDIGVFGLDDIDHSLEPTTPVAPADAFVNVVAEKTHDRGVRSQDSGVRQIIQIPDS